MAIPQSDVSILIPTYRRRGIVESAVQSALDSGAGEIIVSDNCSNDGTVESLAQFADPRLKVVVQSRNLGVFRNHLVCIKLATRPWIKVIESDDRLAPGGLAAYCEHATPQTAVISALVVMEELATGRQFTLAKLSQPRRWTSDEYMERILTYGNELNNTSTAFYRSDVLERDEKLWHRDIAADQVANVIAASRGEVVILPSGPFIIGLGRHQITHNAVEYPFENHATIYLNAQRYFASSPDPRIRRYAAVYGTVEGIGLLRHAVGLVRRGGQVYSGFWKDLWQMFRLAPANELFTHIPEIIRMLRWKYRDRSGVVVDEAA